MSLSGRHFGDHNEAEASPPVLSYRRSFGDENTATALVHDIIEHGTAAIHAAIERENLGFNTAGIGRLQNRCGFAKVGSLPWLQGHQCWNSLRPSRWTQFAAEELAPIGPEPF